MIYIDSLKDLAYSISFKEEDNGLKAILDAEKNIDKNLKNVIASSTKMGNNFNTAGGNANKVTDALADALIKSKETTTGVNAIAEASKKTTGIWKDANGRLRDVNGRFVKLKDAIDGIGDSSQKTDGIWKDANGRLRDVNGKFVKLKDSVDNVSSSTEKASKNTEDIGAKANKTKCVFNKLKDVIVSINSKLKGTEKGTEKVGNKGADTLKNLAKVAGGAFTAKKIWDFGKSSLNVFEDYEQSMANVHATFGKITDGDFEKLKQAASEAGRTTIFSAKEAADGLGFLAQSGIGVDKSISALPGVLNLAIAGNMDLAKSSEMAMDGLHAFGLDVEDLNKFNDQLARSAQKSSTGVAIQGDALMEVAGVAKGFGLNLEETNTQLGLLANRSMKGARGGVGLRNIISNLTANDKVKEILDGLQGHGFAGLVDKKTGKFNNFHTIMQSLHKTLKKFTPTQQEAIKGAIAGKENIQALNSLLEGNTKMLDKNKSEYGDLYEAIKNSNGACDEFANINRNTVKGSLKILDSAMQDLKKSFFEGEDGSENLKNGILKLADNITKSKDVIGGFGEKIVGVFNWVLEHQDGVILAFEGILGTIMTYKTISTIIGIYEHWESITKLLTLAQAGLNAVLNLNPVMLVVSFIGVLIVALIRAYQTSDTFRQACDNLWQSMKIGAEGAINFVIDKLNWAIGKINSFINLLNKIPGVNLGNIGHVNFTKADGKGLTPKRNLLPKKSNSITLQLPGVPQMATGGIVTGPTHALIGEGRESEVVFPLSKLENFLSKRENKAQLDVLSNIKPIIEPQIAINNVSDPREQVPMQSIVNNTTNNSNVTNTRQIENNKSDKPVVINININGADNPKNIAQQVRETIEDIFATASIQLGYTDV